ncbi:pirin family protein [Flavobacteriaceae bacterium]|nr:pirin family protein [Flavobacteriaceae bacterium]
MKNAVFSGPSPEVMMGNIRLKQPLPQHDLEEVDPFVLVHHYGPFTSEPGETPMDLGPHPHRGFEPITILIQGEQLHRDSLGNRSVVQAGEIQWTTAGRGILHSEGPTVEFIENGGTLEGLQIWLNLAQKDKMIQPNYQHLSLDQINYFKAQNSQLSVYAGEFNGVKGGIKTVNDVNIGLLSIEKQGSFTWSIPEGHKSFIYLISGAGRLNEQVLDLTGTRTIANIDGPFEIRAEEASQVLIMTGKPHGDKVVQWGPYVMNSQSEVLEAMRDFQMGKMGFMTAHDE